MQCLLRFHRRESKEKDLLKLHKLSDAFVYLQTFW